MNALRRPRIASGDAMHDCNVFVINDSGTWMLKRPQDYGVPVWLDQAARGSPDRTLPKAR
jgi:hypothetical protein